MGTQFRRNPAFFSLLFLGVPVGGLRVRRGICAQYKDIKSSLWLAHPGGMSASYRITRTALTRRLDCRSVFSFRFFVGSLRKLALIHDYIGFRARPKHTQNIQSKVKSLGGKILGLALRHAATNKTFRLRVYKRYTPNN